MERRRARAPSPSSVNLSASQLRDSTIVSELEAILADAGCAPTWLTLEITETSMVKDVEGVSLTLRKLRRLGFRIAIDDFGTGFSSLSHLRHLPVDTLKIDKSFVADINGDDRRAAESGGAAIVAAVTGLARGLGLEVVAEGVERPSQLAFLRELGCASFQGYLACPPMPVAEFERWLAKQPRPARRSPRRSARKAAAQEAGREEARRYQEIETRAPPRGEVPMLAAAAVPLGHAPHDGEAQAHAARSRDPGPARRG